MLEVADIVRLHGAAYHEQFGNTLTSVQKRALRDIAACRTPFFGGHVYQCDHCRQKVFSYHSCRNRSCPKCHQNQTERWLKQQRDRLLSCPYFLLTFTLPTELRPLARSHPKKIYGLLMRAAADALQSLVRDPRFVGARVGALAVLHTWTRAMLFHPHVHMLVTAGGLSADGSSWVNSKNPRFLVPVRALSVIFRAKFCAALKKAGLLQDAPTAVWQKKWVVHSQHAGRGDKVLQYLARYVFRIAIANSRIESVEDGNVRFRYRGCSPELAVFGIRVLIAPNCCSRNSRLSRPRLPFVMSKSRTRIPESRPAAIPMLASGVFSHHRRICSGPVVAS
jgi:Putative transposase/Transposase zinc-binding domain